MELRYKTSLEEWVNVYLLVMSRTSLRFYGAIIFMGVAIPIFLFYGLFHTIYYIHIYYKSGYDLEGLLFQLFNCMGVITLWFVITLTRKQSARWIQKTFLSKITFRMYPLLLQEKILRVNGHHAIFDYGERKLNIDINHIIEYDNRYYLYTGKYTELDVIPKSIFKSEEQEQLFLKEVGLPVERPIRRLFL
ncbi:hypothetical protein T23_20820 [Turicibacter faecis]|uniref:YcxB-like protein domain-containing protein n=1 Tax=Turicibacter faecis TaxID=2963365 RepID=A0ABN6ZJK5_9FIRM|nr:hypothetical protein T23_20820 [Turicibacter sp. TC023]